MDKPEVTEELYRKYLAEWSNNPRISYSTLGALLTLLARDDPYGPTSVSWLLDSAAETRETITMVTDELVARGYLDPGDDPDHFRGFYPAGDAPQPTGK